MRWIACILCVATMLFCAASSLNAAERAPSGEFQLGPGDVLHISVWKDEALTRDVLVRPDGMISYPLAGEVRAAGRTVKQVRQKLEERLQKYVPDTPVTVVLTQLKSTKIYVVGKVNQPGMYLMDGEMNVMQALALAGGFSRFADKDEIYILRENGNGKKAIPFDYSEVAEGEDLSSNLVLQPGDTVVVR